MHGFPLCCRFRGASPWQTHLGRRFLQWAALQTPTAPGDEAPSADSAALCPFQAVTEGVKGRCLPPPTVLLFLSASQPGATEEQRAPRADSGTGMNLFPCSVSPREDSLQGLEEPSRWPSPGDARPRRDGEDGGRLSMHVGSGLGPVPLRAGATHGADSFDLTPQGSSDPNPHGQRSRCSLGEGLLLGSLWVYLISFIYLIIYLFIFNGRKKKRGEVVGGECC